VRRIFQFDQLADCQELYVAETDEERQAAVIKAAARLPVLTVGETAAFVQQGVRWPCCARTAASSSTST
jgi:hypothetical protein